MLKYFPEKIVDGIHITLRCDILFWNIPRNLWCTIFEFNIFDELNFRLDWDFMRENSRERKLFQELDYMSKLVLLDRDKKCPDENF